MLQVAADGRALLSSEAWHMSDTRLLGHVNQHALLEGRRAGGRAHQQAVQVPQQAQVDAVVEG